jgi:hypothetical protein
MAAQVEGNRAVVALTEKGKKTVTTTVNSAAPTVGVDEKQGVFTRGRETMKGEPGAAADAF